MLFFSYAEEDRQTAQRIAEWLRGKRFEVYLWQDPAQRGDRFIRKIEREIGRADAFLALLSPSFLASPWCGRERELAIQREEKLSAEDPAASFIRVLKISDSPYADAGLLGTYDCIDLTNSENWERELTALAGILPRSNRAESTDPAEAITDADSSTEHGHANGQARSAGAEGTAPGSTFRNRDDELDRVLRGLTNSAGPHFWLVIAPPQLGKTWFLNQIGMKVQGERVSWTVRRVDVRDHPPEVRADPGLLLMHLFGLDKPAAIGPNTYPDIARGILQGRRPHLCLLDSAELLGEETTRALRSCLSQIYRLVRHAGDSDVRFALVVASRRDNEWRGVIPDPRLYPLSLTEFGVDVVHDALRDLAGQMGRTFSTSELEQHAVLAHRLSEGLPALLALCLRWTQREHWVGMHRLGNEDVFENLAHPYIRRELLSPESLFPSRRDRDDERRRAIEQAFQVLAPYRLFTQSHVRHRLQSNRRFERAVEDVEWSMEDLWSAISGAALLSRPLDEPWQAMQPAIRRLLCRYFYPTNKRLAEAHQEARRFAGIWSDGQIGKEQVIGLVECLWHEAAALRLNDSEDVRETLTDSARQLTESLRPSPLYTLTELRQYAARRMRGDEEFQDTVDRVGGLFDDLLRIIAPTEEP